jgi:hypothetical protein
MIRTIWLAMSCLIGLAALTVLKVGTKTFVDERVPSPGTMAARMQLDVLPMGLDSFASEDEARPVRPIAIVPKQLAAAAIQANVIGKNATVLVMDG